MAERIIGIDLGTSNSAAAIIQGGKPTIIPAAEGQTAHGKAFPSVVAFPKDGSPMLVGTPALNQAVTNPENTITKAKRKMGTDYIYKILGKDYKPQQISAFIFLFIIYNFIASSKKDYFGFFFYIQVPNSKSSKSHNVFWLN